MLDECHAHQGLLRTCALCTRVHCKQIEIACDTVGNSDRVKDQFPRYLYTQGLTTGLTRSAPTCCSSWNCCAP